MPPISISLQQHSLSALPFYSLPSLPFPTPPLSCSLFTPFAALLTLSSQPPPSSRSRPAAIEISPTFRAVLLPALHQLLAREGRLAERCVQCVLPGRRLRALDELACAYHLCAAESCTRISGHIVVAPILDGVIEATRFPQELGRAPLPAKCLRKETRREAPETD